MGTLRSIIREAGLTVRRVPRAPVADCRSRVTWGQIRPGTWVTRSGGSLGLESVVALVEDPFPAELERVEVERPRPLSDLLEGDGLARERLARKRWRPVILNVRTERPPGLAVAGVLSLAAAPASDGSRALWSAGTPPPRGQRPLVVELGPRVTTVVYIIPPDSVRKEPLLGAHVGLGRPGRLGPERPVHPLVPPVLLGLPGSIRSRGVIPSLIHTTASRASPQTAWLANGDPVVRADRAGEPVLAEEPVERRERPVPRRTRARRSRGRSGSGRRRP